MLVRIHGFFCEGRGVEMTVRCCQVERLEIVVDLLDLLGAMPFSCGFID